MERRIGSYFENKIESLAEREVNEFISVVEKDFEGTESLEALHRLKEHSEVHYNHSQEVALLANRVGVKLGLNDEELDLLVEAALFHDIGKTEVSKEILEKVESLTVDEFEEVKRHTDHGRTIFKKDGLERLKIIMTISMMHHEFKKNKEKNYPRKESRNEKYRVLGHILAIVDAVQAIADRSRQYNKGVATNIKELIETVERELVLEVEGGYKNVLKEVILAMQESGKYFESETMKVNTGDCYYRYKGKNYLMPSSKNNELSCNDVDNLFMYQQNKYNLNYMYMVLN